MGRRQSHRLLYVYVGREYIISFLVAFMFFFFIFFVNQILVLAQRILLKDVRIGDVLLLVVFSIPQFLMYTMPFSSLASASMVIGDLSSHNEILALQSGAVHMKHIFRPILVISLLLSFSTLAIADRMIPYTTDLYRKLYSRILLSMPALELDSYSSARFGKIVISNGRVDGSTLYDVIIFDDSDKSGSRVITASKANVSVIDIDRYIYKIDLEDPEVLITDAASLMSYSLAKAKGMELYLNLGSKAGGDVGMTPSQMSILQLKEAAASRKDEHDSIQSRRRQSLSSLSADMGEALFALEGGMRTDATRAVRLGGSLGETRDGMGFSFYYQYYRSELQKKLALSLACTFLVFIAFPISFFKVRNGRLIGFAISMLIACAYWFFIYYMHVRAVSSPIHPAFLLWIPNLVVLATGLLLMWRIRK